MDKSENNQLVKFLLLIILLIFIWYLGRFFKIDIEALGNALKKFPVFYSSLVYIILYVIITFLVIFSKDIFYILGAVLFGPALSAFLIYIAETINAFILFHLARILGRAYVEKRLQEKYKKLDETLGKISFFWLFLLRSVPLIPYRFLDLGAGLTKINFKKYLLAVILASPLKLFWIQYILSGVGKNIFKDPYALVEYFLSNKNLFLFSLVYIVVVITVAIKINIERRKKWSVDFPGPRRIKQ